MNLDRSIHHQASHASPVRAGRAPPKYVSCLLPLWGYGYVRQFLDLGLPTWLAEGNLPALAKTLPTRFILLTSREDEAFIRHHPMFKKLQTVCPVVIHHIDHLITHGNYSTTITLAYTEAIRLSGAAVVDTCFFCLVSDYVVANHSFANVLKRMMTGCSAVLVGNFQVAEEDAMPWLLRKLDGAAGPMSLSSRELMRWGLSNLHPATLANTVNYPLSHNDHTNRLFWRVDNLTLIGRFYLMHMICVRPETTDFLIGAACDYSFIPEMCPSDNVEIIADSDEYLVIEMQPRAHESGFLRTGPQSIATLARTLSKWTTERHRKNAETTVVFHAEETPENITAAKQEADRFVGLVRHRLEFPKPFRDHPYWLGAMAAFREATGLRLTRWEFRYALGLIDPTSARSPLRAWLVDTAHFLSLGKKPNLRVWHPRWPDHKLVLRQIEPALQSRSRLLMVSDVPTLATSSIPDGGEKNFRIQSQVFLSHHPDYYDNLHNFFDACLVEIEERSMNTGDQLIDRLTPLLRDGANIIISVYNNRTRANYREFTRDISFEATRLLRPSVKSTKYFFVKAGVVRRLNLRMVVSLIRLRKRRRVVGSLLLMAAAPPLALCSFITNQFAAVSKDKPPGGVLSSFLMVMRVERTANLDAYDYSADRIRRDRRRLRDGDVEANTSRPQARLASDVNAIVGDPSMLESVSIQQRGDS